MVNSNRDSDGLPHCEMVSIDAWVNDDSSEIIQTAGYKIFEDYP